MYLDAVKTAVDYNGNGHMPAATATRAGIPDEIFGKWENFPVSKISHHGAMCCEAALEWLYAMDFSQLNGGSPLTGPRWIRQRYQWGPTQWQIHWCEAVRRKSLDCGAQAALANEVFKARGIRSFPVQFVQKYSREATLQWTKRWQGEDTSIHWINDDLIYHEGNAVAINDTEIKLWDASAAWWINPQQYGGYGSLLAVRLVAAPSHDPTRFRWGNHEIIANRWQRIKQEPKNSATA